MSFPRSLTPEQFRRLKIKSQSYLDPQVFLGIAEATLSVGIIDPAELDRAEDPEHQEFLSDLMADQAHLREEVRKWQFATSLIALYHTVEVKRARMLNQAADSTEDYHRIRVFTNGLRDLGIDHGSMSGSSKMEELRCLVNNFKHSGFRVGESLADAGLGFVKGSEIDPTTHDIPAFAESASSYLGDLSVKLWAAMA